MRRTGGLRMTGWIGLAALGALQYMGPRPLFVKTAYAGAVETVQQTPCPPETDVAGHLGLCREAEPAADLMNE